jgi:GT2 family glycosyltransferase
VVENGSRDGSAALVRERFPGVRLLERPDNPGFGTAVNTVATAPRDGDWLAVATADTAVEPGALAPRPDGGERGSSGTPGGRGASRG